MESYIRIQRARTGKYFQLVLVIPKKDDKEKKEIYYSIPYYHLKNYVDAKTNSLFLRAEKMIPKTSKKYKHWEKSQDTNIKTG